MRGSVRREVVVAVDAAAAWRVVGRPEVLHRWFPGIVDCRVDGDRRTVALDSGLTLDERILTNDDVARRFQYRIEGGPFVEHLASIDVIGLGPGCCLVVYASDADPAPMAIVLGGATGRALDELRHQLEAGHGPALDAVRAVEAAQSPLATRWLAAAAAAAVTVAEAVPR